MAPTVANLLSALASLLGVVPTFAAVLRALCDVLDTAREPGQVGDTPDGEHIGASAAVTTDSYRVIETDQTTPDCGVYLWPPTDPTKALTETVICTGLGLTVYLLDGDPTAGVSIPPGGMAILQWSPGLGQYVTP